MRQKDGGKNILAALPLWVLCVLLWQFSALAEVHYVDVNSTNATPPYTNWTTAATNIQDAVAMSAFERGNFTAGVNQLSAFQNQVRAQVAPWNPVLANEFTAASQKISDVVSGR
jgi:hypothetical protein